MNSQLLVQVFVETSAGDWKRATGCVVASDRIVTAAHVFKGRKAGGEVLVRLYREGEKTRPAKSIWPATLAGGSAPDDDDVDVAVLEVEAVGEAASMPQPDYLLRENAITSMLNVEGRGFPRLTYVEKSPHEAIPQAESFVGRCSHFDPDTPDRSLHLQAESGFAMKSNWQGASGFPVFTWNELVAIGREFLAERERDTIDCVPISMLLLLDGFKAAIRYDEYEARRGRTLDVREELVNLLEQCDTVVARLAGDHENQILEQVGEKRFRKEQAASVAEFLLALDVLPLLRLTDDLHQELCEDEAATDCEDSLCALEAIQDLFVPFAIRRVLDRAVDECREGGSTLDAPFSLKITAESLMAAIDGRQLNLIMLDSEPANAGGMPSLVGSAMLNDPPDRGLDGDQDKFVGDVLMDIARRKKPLQLPSNSLSVLEAQRVPQKAKNQRLARSLSERMKREATRTTGKGRRFYFAISPPQTPRTEDNTTNETPNDGNAPKGDPTAPAQGFTEYHNLALNELQTLLPEVFVIKLGTDFLEIGDGDEFDMETFLNGRQRRNK